MRFLEKLFKIRSRQDDQAPLTRTVQGNTEFAIELFQKIHALQGNLFFSPYSISTALALAYAGARGETQKQMAAALHFTPENSQFHAAFAALARKLREVENLGHCQLKIANNLWPQINHALLDDYLSLVEKYYDANVTPIDFRDGEKARQLINTWVEKETGKKITDLIAPGILDSSTRLVLANAIYFKGDWAAPFDASRTYPEDFHTAPGETVQVPMMIMKHSFKYAELDNLQIVELPYAGNDLSMLVLLPKENDGLTALENTLTTKNLNTWTKDLIKTELELFLPKFEAAFTIRLDDTLKSMGLVDAFSGQADFSGMDGGTDLYLGAAIHKAFVTVNEQGTEAAAATAVEMITKSMPIPAIVFRADHPFVFLIRENSTGSILFLGRVATPLP